MTERPADEQAVTDAAAVRKPYRTPSVVRWGTLREVTKAVGNHGHKDGGRPPRHSTRD